jgi:hypothetical protein
MAFDYPCKPSPLAEASDIHHISGLEEVHSHFLAYLVPSRILHTKFLDCIKSSFSCFFEMPGEGFVHSLAILWKEAELKGVIAIRLLGLFLNH